MIGGGWVGVSVAVSRALWAAVRALAARGKRKHTRPRDLAHWRLSHIIADDRAAVPCGQWVRLRPQFAELMKWQMRAAQNFAFGLAPPLPPRPVPDRRPRYRWEWRR